MIGASIGIGLQHSGWDVTGWDPARGRLQLAEEMGAIGKQGTSHDEATANADLIILAGPVGVIIEYLSTLETEAVVTDVAGVKGPVVAAGRRLSRFVGGHPMAGRETAGPEGASGSLFRGATWVLTTDAASAHDLDLVEETVEGLGAHPLRMTAADHDRAVAMASHLPHVAAAALVNLVAEDDVALGLAAGGFRDLTRVAMSDPGWWVDVLTANGDEVTDALRVLAERLNDLAQTIEQRARRPLTESLNAARGHRLAMAAPVETVGVLLNDEPGEIARVGHSLSESGVDLRDLQLRHAIHGGGGVLTLSVRRGEARRLRTALQADGFRMMG